MFTFRDFIEFAAITSTFMVCSFLYIDLATANLRKDVDKLCSKVKKLSPKEQNGENSSATSVSTLSSDNDDDDDE